MKYTVFLLAFALFNTCSKTENSKIEIDPIDGSWHLISYNAGRALFAQLEPGEVTWTFSSEEQVINVENNAAIRNEFLPLSGKYHFDRKVNTISIDDENFRIPTRTLDILIEDRSLTLSNNPEADGPLLTFIRSE